MFFACGILCLAKHRIPQAKNIPYQPLLIKPIFSVFAHVGKQFFSKLVFQRDTDRGTETGAETETERQMHAVEDMFGIVGATFFDGCISNMNFTAVCCSVSRLI